MDFKIKVHQFDPVIYPSLLWVMVGDEVPKGRFPQLDPLEENAIGQTESTNDEENNKNGVMVRFRNLKEMTACNIAHESVHVAAEMMRYVGGCIEVNNQEPFAYLVGWAADCIEQVKKGKFK